MLPNICHQYWISRPLLQGAKYGTECMAAYAKRCGAKHNFVVHDTYTNRMGLDPRWWDKIRPLFDPFYALTDKVLIADVDIFPRPGLTVSIFDEPVGDFGMVEEPDQPEFRDRWPTSLFSRKADETWANFVTALYHCNIPRDAKGRPRTWNAGVILLSKEGREKLATIRPTPRDYIREARRRKLPAGYCTEQAYLNTLAFLPGVRFTELSLEWNRQVHKIGDGTVYDRRNADTRFTHIMLSGADHHDAAWHDAIVNRV